MTEFDIPKELEILNPEFQAKPILIGKKIHTLYPLSEGQAEKLSKTISKIIYDIYTTDMQCPNCGTVYKDALGKKEVCTKPKCKEEHLEELQKEVVEAILGGGRIKQVLAELFGIPEVDVARATLPQLKYIAGLIYMQNFSPESVPEESEKNFQDLLRWMGLGGMTETTVPSEPYMNTSQVNTDSQENISKGSGKTEN